MQDSQRKIILASSAFAASKLGALFIELGHIIVSELKDTDKKDLQFIIDDYKIEYKEYPRIRTNSKLSKLINERAFIDSEHLDENAIKLIKRYFEDTNDFDLVDQYSSEFKDVYSLKIQDYLNMGHFVDTILAEAYRSSFNIKKMRFNLDMIFNYFFNLVEDKKSTLLLDVSYSHDSERFVLQISSTFQNFKLKEDFFDRFHKFQEFQKECNLFDITFFESRNKFTVSMLWFKEQVNFNAYFLSLVSKRVIKKSKDDNVIHDEKLEKVNYQAGLNAQDDKKMQVVAGDNHKEDLLKVKSEKPSETIKLDLIRKLVSFFQMQFQDSEDFSSLNVSRLRDELVLYPNPSEVFGVNDYTLQKVVDILKNKISIKDLEIQLEGDSGHSKEDIKKVSGENEEEDKAVFVIKGEGDIEKNNSNSFQSGDSESRLREFELKYAKSQEQNQKMKKILEALKKEFLKEKSIRLKIQSENEQSQRNESKENGSGEESTRLRVLMSNNEELRGVVKLKEDRISLLEEKNSQLQLKFSNEKFDFNLLEDKVKNLENDKRELIMKISSLHKEISKTSFSNDLREAEEINRRDKIIDELKAKLASIQVHLSKSKAEKNLFENMLSQNVEEQNKINDQVSGKGFEANSSQERQSSLSEEKETEIKFQKLTAEKLGLEEKLKLQSLELKKLEHKFKLQIKQLEDALKKGSKSKGGEQVIRQLEVANKKLAESSEDLIDKKRDLLKMKTENQQLTQKVQELERKLSAIDKKAA